jgi:hypothetical protein
MLEQLEAGGEIMSGKKAGGEVMSELWVDEAIRLLKAERDKLKAQVAAMREALELFVNPVDSGDTWEAHVKGKQALSPSAGKELLERVRRLEAVVEAAKEVSGDWDIWLLREWSKSDGAQKRVRLLEALADLEEKEAK